MGIINSIEVNSVSPTMTMPGLAKITKISSGIVAAIELSLALILGWLKVQVVL